MSVARAEPLRERLMRWLGERADDDTLRVVFGAMLVATIGVLAVDYVALGKVAASPSRYDPATPGVPPSAEPLPSRDGDKERPAPPQPDGALRERMVFDLRSDGRLMASGTILPGSAEAFAAEVEKRGAYIRTVVLHSPGGSLQDALAMGRLIRERKFATQVDDRRYCASACPLVFAGGIERRAAPRAAIGVHRAVAVSADPLSNESAMAAGQRVSAQAQKYLRDMGVDLQVWIHAMETPNESLYYFKPDELIALKLATPAVVVAPSAAAAPDAPAASQPARRAR